MPAFYVIDMIQLFMRWPCRGSSQPGAERSNGGVAHVHPAYAFTG